MYPNHREPSKCIGFEGTMPLWSMVLIILKNNDRFDINSIVISHCAFRYFYDVRTNRLLAVIINLLIEKTFPKFRMKLIFIIVGNEYLILYYRYNKLYITFLIIFRIRTINDVACIYYSYQWWRNIR